MCRTLPLLFASLLLVGCGARDAAPGHPAPTPSAHSAWTPDDHAPHTAAVALAAAARRQAAHRRRLRQLARARRSPTVPAALRVARLTGRIPVSTELAYAAAWAHAQHTLAGLTGTRAAELGAVVGAVRSLAASHELTSTRLAANFLVLRENTHFWASAPLPAAKYRTSVDGGAAIFQYYPGHGMQLQPLASWGHANALAAACLKAQRTHSTHHPCRVATLTRALDELSGLAARRSGYLAWEYYFQYGAAGTPPWVSGMTQATAVQALARGFKALGMPRWRRTALRALGAFELPPPAGVSVPARGGRAYVLYSFAPSYDVLNGELQAVIGLRDLATLTRSRRALGLYRQGEHAARQAVQAFNTGAWSLYSAGGSESTLSYHTLLAGFLMGLCERVKAPVYCSTGRAFEADVQQPTRIGVPALQGLKAEQPAQVQFSISKVSTVQVRLWGTRGVSLARTLTLAHGEHALSWEPPARGRYHLRITAQGPSGPVGVASKTIRVTLPKTAHRATRKRGSRGHARGGSVTTAPRRPPAA